MAYQFAGFFAVAAIQRPMLSSPRTVWRDVVSPFVGVGIRLPDLLGKTPAPVAVHAMARLMGLDATDRWIYLTYDCFGGAIDFVYGLGVREGEAFGPIEDDNLDRVESAFIDLMGRFGLNAEVARRFEPFHRGFWAENATDP